MNQEISTPAPDEADEVDASNSQPIHDADFADNPVTANGEVHAENCNGVPDPDPISILPLEDQINTSTSIDPAADSNTNQLVQQGCEVPQEENEGQSSLNLKEWSSMDHLLSKIPLKAQKGLNTFDLELTCVDIVDDYIALGTNVGLIYWYRRSTDCLERLKVEGSTSPVTVVRVISSIDYIVAAGTKVGSISIFQIPKLPLAPIDDGSHASSDSSSTSNNHTPQPNENGFGWGTDNRRPSFNSNDTDFTTKKKVQIFTVRDMHKSRITALEWSTNGMKLFSGDFNGLVIYTEMDYCSGVSKSVQLWNETCEIVQLSYAHRSLVISSIYQTLLFKTESNSCQKVGSQERKMLGRFGGVYESGLWNKNLKLFVVRPGLRIWIADFDGLVKNTIVLKDWYNSTEHVTESNGVTENVTPAAPTAGQAQSPPQQEPSSLQFGLIFNFVGKYLLTVTSSHLFVIDPINIQILASFAVSIQSMGVHGNEIFVLENPRHLIRLSTAPDPHLYNNNDSGTNGQGHTMDQQQWPHTISFLSQKLKKTTAAIQKSTILNTFKNAILETNDYLQDNARMNALSSLSMMPPSFYDVPHITVDEGSGEYLENGKPAHSTVSSAVNDLEFQRQVEAAVKKFDKISQESFKEIVLTQFKPEPTSNARRTKGKKHRSKDGQSPLASGTNTPNTLMSDSVSIYSSSSGTNMSENASDPMIIINRDTNPSATAITTDTGSAVSSSNGSPTSGVNSTDGSSGSSGSVNCSNSVHKESQDSGVCVNFSSAIPTTSQDQFLDRMECRVGMIPALEELKYYKQQQERETSEYDLESKEVMLAKLLNWSELLPENAKLANSIGGAEMKSPPVIGEDPESEADMVDTNESTTDQNQPFQSERNLFGGSFDTSTTTTCSSESTVKDNVDQQYGSENGLDDSSLDIYTKYGDYSGHHMGRMEDGTSSLTSGMSFGPPSGSSNIMSHRRYGVARSDTSSSFIYEDEDDGRSGDSYGSGDGNNVLDLQLDQLVAASCSGASGSSPFGASGSRSSLAMCGGSLVMEQDMRVDGIVGNDEWVQFSLPAPASSFAASDSYVVCVDTKQFVYYSPLTSTGCHSLCWVKTDYKAQQMAVSSSGHVVWRLHNGVLYSLTFPSMTGPFTIEGEWITIGAGVKSISVDNEVGWMVKNNGSVYMCKRIKDGKPIPLQIFEPIPCCFSVDEIRILGNHVWALTDGGKLFYRNKISVVNLQGCEWIQFKFTTPFPSTAFTIATISLGPSDTLWFMDTNYNLYFINGITHETPGGDADSVWVVNVANCCMNKLGETRPVTTYSSTANCKGCPNKQERLERLHNWKLRLVETLKNPMGSLMPSKPFPILSAKYSSVWFTQYGATDVWANRTVVTGHRWEPVQPSPTTRVWKWGNIFGNGIYRKHGLLWLLDTKRKLFHMSMKGKLQGLELPVGNNGVDVGAVTHVAPAPEALWILMSKGGLYGRSNITCGNDVGQHWDEIPLSPLENVTLTHVSCGSDVAWACDSDGQVYIRLGSLHPPQSIMDMCAPWIQVEGGPISSQGSKFTKVYVGTNGHMVWALDNKYNVYTRVAIFPDVPIGTEWVLVSGIEAESLAISDSYVWALSPKGEIFCRYGLTNTNFIGEFWRRVPGSAKTFSVSVCNQLWALDQNSNLMKHSEETINFPITSELSLMTPTPDMGPPVELANEADDGEWEFLG